MAVTPETQASETYVPPDEDAPESTEAAAASSGPIENRISPASVTRLTDTAASVSFGWTAEGRVPFSEFVKVEGKPQVKPGDTFEVLVESLADGAVVVSKDKAEKLRRWDAIVQKCSGGQTLEGTVVSRVNGGYSVDIGLRAFLPQAQADLRRVTDPDALLGETFTFKVTEFDKRRGNIVLSRKSLLEKELKEKKKETMAKLAEGAVLPGTVKTITDYGAFIDLGGVDGLLHVSDLSWGRVNNPRELLTVGQELEVKVIKLDPANNKIGLGLKQLTEDPWAHADEKYKPGTLITGKVKALTDFGAFIAIEPGLEGLVHVSEMSWVKRVKHPSEELKIGDEVKASILDIDPVAKRLGLSLKKLQQNPWSMLEEQYPPGTVIRSRVRSVTEFGVFLGVLEGIDGLVHISELSWTQRVKHPGELYKKGDEVEAVVLSVDVENERFSLSIKQLKGDPWHDLPHTHPVGSKLKGKVTKVLEFGAFLEIEPGVEGLIHVSELRAEHTDNAGDVVAVGDELEVVVLDIDSHEHKIALSVRALTAAAQEPGDDYRDYMNRSDGKASLGEVFGDKLKK